MTKANRTGKAILNMSTGIAGQLLATLLKFVVRTVFIKTLEREYLGVNGLFSDILTMLSLTELGLDTAINFRLYKPLADGDEKRIRVLMKFYKQAYRIIGGVIFAIGLLCVPLLPFVIKDYGKLEALNINAGLIFMLHIMRSVSSYLFFAYRSAIMKADQKKYVLDLVGFVVTILTSIAKILVLVLWHDFVLYTATVIVFNVIQNFVNAIIAKKAYPKVFEKEEDSISKAETWSLLKDCGALFLYRINGVVAKATDNIVISSFLGLNYVSLYSTYLLFFTTIKSLLNKLYSSAKASMGNLFATESVEKRYEFFQIMNFLSILLFGTAGVGVAVCADELIRVWLNKTWLLPQPFAILIGIEVLVHGLTMNLGQIREVSGAFRQMWFRPILSAIINLGVSVILVQVGGEVWGIHGVILGTIISAASTNLLIDPHLLHKYSFQNIRPVSQYFTKNGLYVLDLIAVCALDYVICTRVFVGHGWFSAIAHIVFVGVSVPAVLLFTYWNTNECRYVVRTFKRLFAKIMRKKARSN